MYYMRNLVDISFTYIICRQFLIKKGYAWQTFKNEIVGWMKFEHNLNSTAKHKVCISFVRISDVVQK